MGTCLLCVERGLKYCNYLRLSPTMFFLCTFYSRSSISEPPRGGGEVYTTLPAAVSSRLPTPHSTSRHVSKTRKFCATKLLLYSSLFAFDTHMALATFFFIPKMDNTYAHEICWEAGGAVMAEAWGWEREWVRGGSEKSINENCLFQISLFLVSCSCRTHIIGTTITSSRKTKCALANCRRQ